MSGVLYRWGRFAATRPWRVLGAWLLVVVGVGALLLTQDPRISTTLTLRQAPAQQVLDEVEASMPEAGGTQGVIVFTARDGGRVDDAARADAIGAAMDAAVASGIVVDRAARVAEQQAEVEARVRSTVEDAVASDVSGQLDELVAALEGAKAAAADAAASAPPARRQEAATLGDRLDVVMARAQELLAGSDAARIEGAAALFGDVAGLRTELAATGLTGVQLPEGDSAMADPVAAVEAAVADDTQTAMARLAGLTGGTDPRGTALVTTAGDRPSVLVSADGTTAVATVQLTEQVSDLPAGALDGLLADVRQAAAPAGLDTAASSALQPLEPPLGGHEMIGLGVAAVVLLVTLGSLLLAGLPILTALLGVLIGVGGAYALSANFEMTTSTPALGLMLGLAVGIDYALFLVHKQRSLRTRLGLDPVEATARATATAGGAVVFAGTTVIIALLGLITLGMGFVTTMALTAAVTVALAVALSVTAVPALLGLIGERARAPRRDPAGPRHDTTFGRAAQRWLDVVTARPVATIVVVVLGLGALAVPAFAMHLGMPSGAVAQPGSAARVAYDGVTRTLGEGANAPLVVALTPEPGTEVDQELLETWQAGLADRDGVANVQLMGTSQDAGLVLFTVVPQSGPTDQATADLVEELRDSSPPERVERVGVTGLTALNVDLTEALAAAIPVYLAIVAALSLLVLLLVFRSIVVPVVATAGFLLSIGATMGLVVTAFGNDDFTWLAGVDRAGPVLSFLPIMATGILYGLAMDYQVFLGTSVREEHVHGATARRAVVDGFHHASRVVLAAAVIMISVFAGFVLSSDTTIRQFGFALAAGILIDAFLIRMTLIPAVLHLTGERAWWIPRWLDKLLPEVDVEGSRLKPTVAAAAPVPPVPSAAS